jgi:hypothetical protein
MNAPVATMTIKTRSQKKKLPWDMKAPHGKGGLYRFKAVKKLRVKVKGLKYNEEPEFQDSGRSDHHLEMTSMSTMYETMKDMGYDGGCDSE